jgi:hypothetical protein
LVQMNLDVVSSSCFPSSSRERHLLFPHHDQPTHNQAYNSTIASQLQQGATTTDLSSHHDTPLYVVNTIKWQNSKRFVDRRVRSKRPRRAQQTPLVHEYLMKRDLTNILAYPFFTFTLFHCLSHLLKTENGET